MYLSRLILNPKSRAVLRDLGNCQDMHRSVLRAFPDVDTSETGARAQLGVLYRLEADARKQRYALFVQSEEVPDWDELPEDYLHPLAGTENPGLKEMAPVLEGLEEGQVLGFRLRANPTRKVEVQTGNGERKKRREALNGLDEQIEWIERKADQSGFQILPGRRGLPQVRATSENLSAFFRGRKRGHNLTFASVLYEGFLRIEDLETFHAAVRDGIGPAKSYGFGLLSLAPPQAMQRLAMAA